MQSGWLRRTSVALALGGVTLSGCVMKSTYTSMLKEQQSIESSLRAEISADQVQIEELKDGIHVRLASALLYREGGVELSEQGRTALDKVAPQLAAEAYEIDVIGNTDNLPIGAALAGRYATNWELAAERATIVVRYLQAHNVNPSRMRGISAGQYHPVAPNDSPEGRASNRRTELLLRPR